MKNIKEEKIEETQKYIDNIKEELSILLKLEKSLLGYDKKIIDKRFFEKYFFIPDENGEPSKRYDGSLFTSLSISKNEYSWGKPYKIHLKGYASIDLDNREREHILSVCLERVKNDKDNIEKIEDDLAKTKAVDLDKVVKEIRNVCIENSVPTSLWGKILDDYSVKYPNKD
jgi:hypothetical protein